MIIIFKLAAFCVCFFCFYGIQVLTEEVNLSYITPNNENTLQVYSNNQFPVYKELSNNETIISFPTNSNNNKIVSRKIKRLKNKKHKKITNSKQQNVGNVTLLKPDKTLDKTKTNGMTREIRKRKRKKRRQKKREYDSIILEVTTASIKNASLMKAYNNSVVNDLINLISNNSENMNLGNVKETIFSLQKFPNENTMNSTNKRKNRCTKNNGGCSHFCKSKGKTKCSCLKGFKLAKNRKKCVDINECRFNNGGCKNICKNTLGTFYCDCHSGYRIADDLKSCEDVNECHLSNGHGPCQDTCTNTIGSYICDCSHLNGTRLSTDKKSCEDINECDETRHGCSHLCINTRVGAFCSCPEGMELMSDYKTCEDVDECEDTFIRSLCKRGCVNTVGSYYCEDDLESSENFNSSKVPMCPPLNPPVYGYISCLRNATLPYDTFTKSGRRIIKNSPGTKCRLVCPIGFKLIGGGRFVCSISGNWITRGKGSCIKASYPKLVCPLNQTITLTSNQEKAPVSFSRPQTNIRWKIVKSYPKWAKKFARSIRRRSSCNSIFSYRSCF